MRAIRGPPKVAPQHYFTTDSLIGLRCTDNTFPLPCPMLPVCAHTPGGAFFLETRRRQAKRKYLSFPNPFKVCLKQLFPPIKPKGFWREPLLPASNFLSQHPKSSSIFMRLPWEPRHSLADCTSIYTHVCCNRLSSQCYTKARRKML